MPKNLFEKHVKSAAKAGDSIPFSADSHLRKSGYDFPPFRQDSRSQTGSKAVTMKGTAHGNVRYQTPPFIAGDDGVANATVAMKRDGARGYLYR